MFPDLRMLGSTADTSTCVWHLEAHISCVLVDSGSGGRLTPLRADGAIVFFFLGGPAHQVQGRSSVNQRRKLSIELAGKRATLAETGARFVVS